MKAKDVMTEEALAVRENSPLAHIKNLFLKHDIGRVLVTEEEEVTGVVSAWEIAKRYYQDDDIKEDIPAKELKKTPEFTEAESEIDKAAEKVLKNGETIVRDKGSPIGIITKTNLIKQYINLFSGKATVSEVMTDEIHDIKKDVSAFQAIKKMRNKNIKKLVVRPIISGILTQRDLALASKGMRPKKLVYHTQSKGRVVEIKSILVEDLMKEKVVTIPKKSDTSSAANLMLSKDIGSLVTTKENEPTGIITKTDITRKLLNLYKEK